MGRPREAKKNKLTITTRINGPTNKYKRREKKTAEDERLSCLTIARFLFSSVLLAVFRASLHHTKPQELRAGCESVGLNLFIRVAKKCEVNSFIAQKFMN